MAVNAGEVSVALTLDQTSFAADLEAARASLNGFAQELATLSVPPEVAGAEALGAGVDVSPQFAAMGASAGAAFGASAGASAALALGSAGAGVSAAGARLAQSFAASVASAASALNSASQGASQAGARFAQSFAAGIASGAGLATAGAAGVASAAASAAQGSVGKLSAAGRAFSAGLASGIRSGRSGVVSAAIAVASAAAAAARSALAIHSPSKVTREMGESFDLGFIRGVEGMRSDIERSVRAAVQLEPLASAALGAGREAVEVERSSAQPIDYDRLADAMNQRQMVLMMDNRRLAQVQERETARAQSQRNRKLALGYGK